MKIKVNESAVLASSLSNMNIIERDIFILLSQKIKNNLGNEVYSINYNEIINLFENVSQQKRIVEMRKMILEISQKNLVAYKSGVNMYRHWFSAINDDKIQNKITFKIIGDVKPYFLLLNKINSPEINLVDNIKSKTGKILYIYLCIYKEIGEITLSYEEMKNMFYTGFTDIKINDLFRKHIDKAVEEINEKTNFNIKYEKMKDIESNKYSKLKIIF